MEKNTDIKDAHNTAREIAEICCNIDDMTGEEIGYALEFFLEEGALEAYTIPIGMKKGRPGVLLTVLTQIEDRDRIAELMLTHTTTVGVRWQNWQRKTLTRTFKTVETEFGTVRVKESSGYGVSKAKAEYEDMAKLARENNVPISKIREAVFGKCNGRDCE